MLSGSVTESETEIAVGGSYHFRTDGEYHLLNPLTISKLQHAVRQSSFKTFQEYTDLIDQQSRNMRTLRSLMQAQEGEEADSIEEVEPAKEIVKRFTTGAMSFGSISKEAHETLAIAMNRIGGMSNTGEGGEDEARFIPDANGDLRRSAVKQVASARFGVTANYLVNADELQIKMAQGAKPGEGGQLPGHKVDEVIARLRHSIPGVGLISPPPHHDIYSIEDLAQLIYDLKNVNPRGAHCREAGLGSWSGNGSRRCGQGACRCGADQRRQRRNGRFSAEFHQARRIPWELGLAETQQVLLLNDLRSRIRVQTDGKLQTGRDVVIAALLGAEEFGFATTPLITMGCIMMRKCHLNTCSVGIATQDPELRKQFQGQPEHVINFFFFLAEQVRQYMAELGFRTVDEMVGRVDMLEAQLAVDHWKAQRHRSLRDSVQSPISGPGGAALCADAGPRTGAGARSSIDRTCEPALGGPHNRWKCSLPIRNIHRTVGAMLGGEIARRYGSEGLPDETIRIRFEGSAGQSFGRFLAKGVTLTLEGEANDYVGKGLSGGRLIIYPPRNSGFRPKKIF